ncbi:GSCFA domain-containing protein [Taibaiella lutea]|nr:GSCFA domain-containing protein [Taibaiella lutea]
MLCGSCFTENIGSKMSGAKMNICMNPQGILFNPMSIANCLEACMDNKEYNANELFQHNEIWNHWDFHSRFSGTDKDVVLSEMNRSIKKGNNFLKQADWLIITFGSSYQYFLSASNDIIGVGNCHKAPGNWFEKRMLDIDEMQQRWQQTLDKLKVFNPNLKIIFTISPVRHYRDGLAENNLSKARLFELIYRLADKKEHLQYFPAFEIVNDVLRDYRFFEQDMVHPNHQATQFVWEQFVKTYFNDTDINLSRQIEDIITALNHRPRFKETSAHQRFQEGVKQKIVSLKGKFPYLNFDEEMHQMQY